MHHAWKYHFGTADALTLDVAGSYVDNRWRIALAGLMQLSSVPEGVAVVLLVLLVLVLFVPVLVLIHVH